MGREARRVPANWQHPRDEITGAYKPLRPYSHYRSNVQEFLNMVNTEGLKAAVDDIGELLNIHDYMPDFPPEQCTHLMMYEDTTEGTPISPAFKTPEELAMWLVNNNARVLCDYQTSYVMWLGIIYDSLSVAQ